MGGGAGADWELLFNVYKVSIWDDEKVWGIVLVTNNVDALYATEMHTENG